MPYPVEQLRMDIDEQAADWFGRRRGERFSAADEALFQHWLSASPVHAQSFADLELLWDDMDLMQPPQAFAQPQNVTPLPRRNPRRLLAMAASVALMVGLLSVTLLVDRPQFDLTAQSEPGQLRELSLVDGSQITLNMGSSVEVRYFDDRREVTLQGGEAFFSVAPDNQRPFVISAGSGQVTVVGTRFNVRLGEQLLDVAVEQGKVAVNAGSARMPPVLLSAGEVVQADYQSGQQQMSRLAPDEVASWRSGQLIFHERPLAQLLQELSRYLGKPVALADASLAERKLSGSLDIYQPQDFLSSLPLLLPVRVDTATDGSVSVNGL